MNISSNSEKRTTKLSGEVEEAFSSDSATDAAQVVVATSSLEDRSAAQELGISTGRYAVLKQSVDESESTTITVATVDEYKAKTVKELVGTADNNTGTSEKQTTAAAAASTTGITQSTTGGEAASPASGGDDSSTTGDSGVSASSQKAGAAASKKKKSTK